MTDWLVLQLYGPMASWGDIAVGEYRPTSDRPGRSAILGLLAAALGIRTDQHEEQELIRKGYLVAFRMDYEGCVIRDYHTTHVPSSGTGRNRHTFFTRRDELKAPEKDISTILSSRDYRCDTYATVFITPTENSPYSLQDLLSSLKNPVFVLYLGRKSCPPALPLHPRIISANTLKEASSMIPLSSIPLKRRRDYHLRFFWEDGILSGLQELHAIVRRDEPVSRKRRQFANRIEHVGLLPVEGT